MRSHDHWLRGAFVALVLTASLPASTVPSAAYEIGTTSDNCPRGRVFEGDVAFEFNTYDLPSYISAWDFAYLVYDMFERFNRTGGSSLDLSIWGSRSSEPDPANGVSEVSFYGDFFTGEFSAYDAYVEFDTPSSYYSSETCSCDEECTTSQGTCDEYVGKCFECRHDAVDVYIRPDDVTWVLGVPEDEGDDFYTTGDSTASGHYLRLTFMHELAHVGGLLHVWDRLGVMNINETWTNRSDEKMVELLGDDRAGVRVKYPNDVEEIDVSVVNTWYEYTGGSYAYQYLICNPSSGDSFGDSSWPYWISPYPCGSEDGSLGMFDDSEAVCPGDDLYVRYSVNNNSTQRVTVTEELWFSENDWLNTTAGYDLESATTYSGSISSGYASWRSRTFKVPRGLTYGEEYYVIAHAVLDGDDAASEAASESTQNNWIPLTGKIRIKALPGCLERFPWGP